MAERKLGRITWGRNYSEVFGADEHGARYVQDGLHFDTDGVLIDGHPGNDKANLAKVQRMSAKSLSPMADKPSSDAAHPGGVSFGDLKRESVEGLKDTIAKAKTEDFTDDLDAIEEATGLIEDEEEPVPAEAPVKTARQLAREKRKPSPKSSRAPGGKVDLRAWATGKEKTSFPRVRSQIKEQYNFVATDKNAALTFLADQGVVRMEDLEK